MTVRCQGLSKAFDTARGRVVALHDVSFEVAEHEFVCIVGPSGCGKTTLLKLLAGLLEPTTGDIVIGAGSERGRATALVFQDHGLFPWMTVLDNVAFGLEAKGVPRSERTDAARVMIARVGLQGFAEAFPHQLSGGMQQRVGIARALLVDPELLLMDEPFGALDAQTKLVMQEELLRIWQGNRKEVIYVTHDVGEAVRLGDRVLVMSGRPGRVLADVPVELPRPRDISPDADRAAVDLRRIIWGLLESEVRESMAVQA